MLEPPYNPRLDRVCLTEHGEAKMMGRAGWKKVILPPPYQTHLHALSLLLALAPRACALDSL